MDSDLPSRPLTMENDSHSILEWKKETKAVLTNNSQLHPNSSISYSRPLHGAERLWAYAHKELNGAFDMVSLFSISRQGLTQDITFDTWKNAWKLLCQEEPILACKLDYESQTLTADDFALDNIAWSRWQDETVKVKCISPGQHICAESEISHCVNDNNSLHSLMMDHCLQTCEFQGFQLVLFQNSSNLHKHSYTGDTNITNGPEEFPVSHIAVTNNHALADTNAVIRLTLRLFALVSTIIRGDISNSNMGHNDNSVGSIFSRRLPPALMKVCSVEPSSEELSKLLNVAAKPSHGLNVIPMQARNSNTRTSNASINAQSTAFSNNDPSQQSQSWRKMKTFEKVATDRIIARCKMLSITLTSMVQACIAHAVLKVNPPLDTPLSSKRTECQSNFHQFTIAAMPFSKMLDIPPAERRNACFMAMTVNPISFSVEARLQGISAEENVTQMSLEHTAKNVHESLNQARGFPLAAQENYIGALLSIYEAMRSKRLDLPKTTFPTLSSLGNLDRIVDEVGNCCEAPSLTELPAVQLESYQIGSRNSQPTLGVHAWTLKDQLNVTLAWCPGRVCEIEVDMFWDEFIHLLNRFT